MTTLTARPRKTGVLATMTGLVVVLAASASPAFAQDDAGARLKKVETEVRALQRKVFGSTDSKYFTPEIAPADQPVQAPPPASSPVTDLLQRMDAIEGAMQRLTAQVEQNTNRIGLIEARLAAATPAPAAAVVDADLPPARPATVPAPQGNLDAMTGGASATRPTPAAAAARPAAAKPAATTPSPARLAAVQAVARPQTDDAGDDEYSYGFRLWEAKLYPEAQQQLKLMLEKYPKHRRASWARNLVGRAYLDEGNAVEAAKWFVQNYQTDKRGERAPDSLLYLALAMKQVNDSKRACIALAEFSATYAAEAAGRLRSTYETTRSGLNCSA